MQLPIAGFVRIFCISTSLACATVAEARSYAVDGLVLDVDPPSFTVAHRPIRGVMQAMTMSFKAESPEQLKNVRPGARVRFDWRNNVARDIRVLAADDPDMPKPVREPVVGEPAPRFRLVDQLNREVTMESLRGKLVALNFLYTRCPMPEVCPRLAANFATAQRRFESRLGSDLVLVSVTIDPACSGGWMALFDRSAGRR